MPAEEQNGALVVVVNQRFKNRLVIALSCLVYALDYLSGAYGAGRVLPYFLLPSADLAILFFALYAGTWVSRPGNGVVRVLTWITVGGVSLHLLGAYALTFDTVPAVLLLALVVLVNLLVVDIRQVWMYNPVLL